MDQLNTMLGFEVESLLYLVPIIVAITNSIKKWIPITGWGCMIPTVVVSGLMAWKLTGGDWWSLLICTLVLTSAAAGTWETIKLGAKKINGGTR